MRVSSQCVRVCVNVRAPPPVGSGAERPANQKMQIESVSVYVSSI